MRLFAACILFALSLPALAQTNMQSASFAGGTLNAKIFWMQGPRSPQESVIKLQWIKSADNSAAAAPGQFQVAATMSMMGEDHGSPPTTVQPFSNDKGLPELGSYLVTGIYFVMSGHWDLKISVQYPDGKTETQSIGVDVP